MAEPTRALSRQERLDCLRLIRSDNVGPITFFQLLRNFGAAGEALAALPDLSRRGGRARALKPFSRAAAESEMAAYEAIGARLVAWCEPEYPPLLAEIDSAPPLVSLRGHAQLMDRRMLAIVGARNASANGRRIAERLAADLGAREFVIVSGLARGIDTSAHRGALETGTVAVLAGGIDVVYPRENADLFDAIAESGALISEIAPGTQPTSRHFPRRNRLISGMALGILVVEAAARSGSLITARLALEQGREVLAIPGSPMDPRARGANDLIRQGATLVESADDVIDALEGFLRPPLAETRRAAAPSPAPTPPSETELAAARRDVGEMLGPSPVAVDEIIRRCQLSFAVLSMVLLEFELAGRLERHPGNQVSIVGSLDRDGETIANGDVL